MDKQADAILKFPATDEAFNSLYPYSIQLVAKRHWTPIHVTRLAAAFLCKKGCRVLDIGSGVGKFCITAAAAHPTVHFYGVEQRTHLVRHAGRVQKELGIENVSFINSNVTDVDLAAFDNFYFYNSFFENIDDIDKIDSHVQYSEANYVYYVAYLKNALQGLPAGTRIVTYHSIKDEIPPGYYLVEKHEGGDLNFWEKK
jgi:SAM-dependent methyltransferase